MNGPTNTRKHLMYQMLTRRESCLSRSKGFVSSSRSNTNHSLGFSGTLLENSLFFILGLITTLDLRPLTEQKLPAILTAYLIAMIVNLEGTLNDI